MRLGRAVKVIFDCNPQFFYVCIPIWLILGFDSPLGFEWHSPGDHGPFLAGHYHQRVPDIGCAAVGPQPEGLDEKEQ